MLCLGTKTDGTPCSTDAQDGRIYCFWHDPEKKDQSYAASVKGGENRKVYIDLGEEPKLDTALDVRNYLTKLIKLTSTKQLDPKVGGQLVNMCAQWLKANEQSELQDEVSKLKKMAEERGL